MTRRPATSIAGTPILIGAVTVLIGVIAVFLAYNANSGLPFIPSYRVTAEVYDAAGLVDGNEVRVGGKRVGTVQSIAGRIGQHGTYAELQLKLDKAIQPIRDDSQVRVRPRSPLGLKYLELMPGRFGRAIGIRADVTAEADVEAMIAATVEAFGGLDVLVNNANSADPAVSRGDSIGLVNLTSRPTSPILGPACGARFARWRTW